MLMYIKQTYYSFAVCIYNKILREFVTYEEALEYIKNAKEKNYVRTNT